MERFYCVFERCPVCAFSIVIVLVFTEATAAHADPHGREAVHVLRLRQHLLHQVLPQGARGATHRRQTIRL